METITGKENLGNTNPSGPSFRKKCKNAIMTLHEKNFDKMELIIKYLEHYKAFQYLLICEHDGPSEIHRHIYVQFENARTLDSRYLYGCHLEEAFESAQKNIEYLKGLDSKHKAAGVNSKLIYENGKAKERGNINTIADLKKITNADEVPAIHFNTWNKIKSNKIKLVEWHKKVKVIYIYCNESGVGKSYLINKIMNNEMIDKKGKKFDDFDEVKHVGEFWLGVGGDVVEGCAIYDDFRDSDLKASEFINFIDYNVHNLNYKGGSAKNKYTLIIFTSIQDPHEIYKGVQGEPRKQWLRRMRIINLSEVIREDLKQEDNEGYNHNHESNHDDLLYKLNKEYVQYMCDIKF